MQIEQSTWKADHGWTPTLPGVLADSAQLVLVFGARAVLQEKTLLQTIRKTYSHAHMLGCSTAGEICGARVFDDSLVVTAIHFEATTLQGSRVYLSEVGNSLEAGFYLGETLDHNGLVHVLVLSDGTHVNGSDLVRGLSSRLPPHVAITGGLAGDGSRFEQTLVCFDGPAEEQQIVALGLYSNKLRIGYASVGGWDPFGPPATYHKIERQRALRTGWSVGAGAV